MSDQTDQPTGTAKRLKFLEEFRRDRHQSQAEFASELGIRQGTYSKIVAGRLKMSVEVKERLRQMKYYGEPEEPPVSEFRDLFEQIAEIGRTEPELVRSALRLALVGLQAARRE